MAANVLKLDGLAFKDYGRDNRVNELKTVSKNGYLLLGIASSMIAIHFTMLTRKSIESNIVSLHFLLFVGIASLVWEERSNLKLKSSPVASVLGALLIGLILLRTLTPLGYDVAMAPFIFGIGICLLSSGANSFKYFRKELILLSLTAFYPKIVDILIQMGITKATAQASSFLLWASGFSVYRNGVQIILPKGRVEVLSACAGVDSMLLMLTVTIFFFILIQTKLKDKIICLIVAALISFWLNSFRIAILALLANSQDMKGFEYWHGGDGSLVFSVLSVGVFAVFCWFFYVRKALENSKN